MIHELINKIKIWFAWEEGYFDSKTKSFIEKNHTTDTIYVYDVVFKHNSLKPVMYNSITKEMIDI